jgi:hypothetical protein
MSYQVRNAKRAAEPHIRLDHQERGPCFATLATVPGEHGFSAVNVLRAFCERNNIQLDYASEYGEPGYTAPARGILFCNWNDVPEALQDRLEGQGYALEWSDEWYVDSDNSPCKAWRSEPDHMGWESRVRYLDGDVITPDSDPQEWIDSSLNEQDTPLPSWFDDSELEARGFGMMPDTTNDDIAPALRKEGYDVILRRGDSQVFHEVWTRREAKRELFLSDARGVYIPRDFAQSVVREHVTGVSDENYSVLEAGPDHEWYWEAWTEVCDSAVITATDGTVYRLEQDGDCWLVEAAGEFCAHDDTYYVHKE